jgi:hypothetical protein
MLEPLAADSGQSSPASLVRLQSAFAPEVRMTEANRPPSFTPV